MKKTQSICRTIGAALLAVAVSGALRAGTIVHISHFKADISPELGANICGYAPNQRAVEKRDPLYLCGLLIDDGKAKALIATFDLVGLDASTLRGMREKCARVLDIPPSSVFFSCTHNHSGPECVRRLNLPDSIDLEYVAKLEETLISNVRALKSAPRTECEVMFNSAQVDENYNRRFVTSDNVASFTPHRRVLIPGCDGISDKELGMLFFFRAKREPEDVPGYDAPVYIIGNYAAHVLSTHAPGIGGIRITADFPGFYRDYLKQETGAEAMFIQGAGGDLVPKGDELGVEAARRTGVNLAMATINAAIDCMRNPGRFTLNDPCIRSSVRTFSVPMRKRFKNHIQPEYRDSETMPMEVQCLSIGDIALAGMPGELVSGLGLEIKWHSPFRRTWIAGLSTGFIGYICTANMFVQGGYEPKKQPFVSTGGLALVNETVEALRDLREASRPGDVRDGEAYPDYLDEPLVRIPGGVKATNFNFNEDGRKNGKDQH